MKHTIKPVGGLDDLVEKGLAKKFFENDEGKKFGIEDYANPMLPGGGKNHRVFWGEKERRYRINITKEDLQFCVDEMRLTDPKNGKLIEKADPRNEKDPFFIHDELQITVPNAGITIDDETGWGLYWWRAANSEPKKFNVNNNTDNPLVLRGQDFKVTSAGQDENERDKEIAEGMRATDIFAAIKNNFKELLIVARAMDIIVSDNPPIKTLQDTIYLKITTDKDYLTKDKMRNIDKFFQVTDMKTEDRTIRAMVTEAVDLQIITYEGKNLIYEDEMIGTTNDKAFQFFMKKGNEKFKASLISQVAEKSATTT